MYLKVEHIGIAVKCLDSTLEMYEEGLGLTVAHLEEVPAQKTRVAMLPIGESKIELLEAMCPDSPIGRFLEKRGEGLHHICLEVENITSALDRMKTAGVKLIDEVPRRGAGGCLVAFIHPSATGGVLIELSQSRSEPEMTTEGS